ncbi:hypothetical protein E1287_10805 [Actinomadura sp. KC06]|uniref:hypothetical protein n=1 Tax=Actinomadura sp. KC06 TaxID=2530369 RepID=UPI00104AFD7C|nr:hypothetical protein [Actinomadura sp. KC06]TDD36500.1 hypothetical protein E1287_10805 [Actinomadura sp. KC06]
MNSLPRGAALSPARKPAVPDDFNGDGYRDIAGRGPDRTDGDLITVIYGGPKGADPARRQLIAAPGGGSGIGTERRSVSVVFGTRTGLDTKALRTYRHGFRAIPDRHDFPGRFGGELSLTDTDRNGEIELVVGAPHRDGKEGRLYIFTDAAEELTTKGMRRFTPADLGIAGRKAELGGTLLG